MINPRVEMQRLAGKAALLLAGVYLIIVVSAITMAVGDQPIPIVGWPLLVIPVAAFAPAVIDGVRLHRTADDDVLSRLSWRCLGLAGFGLILMVAAVMTIGQVVVD